MIEFLPSHAKSLKDFAAISNSMGFDDALIQVSEDDTREIRDFFADVPSVTLISSYSVFPEAYAKRWKDTDISFETPHLGLAEAVASTYESARVIRHSRFADDYHDVRVQKASSRAVFSWDVREIFVENLIKFALMKEAMPKVLQFGSKPLVEYDVMTYIGHIPQKVWAKRFGVLDTRLAEYLGFRTPRLEDLR